MIQPEDVLSFWFERSPDEPGRGHYRKVWFSKNLAFDRAIQSRFQDAHAQAAAGTLDHWQDAEGCLARVLLLDQMPRHLFRGQARSFATDAAALEIANRAIARRLDQSLPLIQRWFLYLPFMHSETLADQQRSLDLFASLKHDPEIASAYDYAQKHLDVIAQFGRFPHRNAIVGRTSTPAEVEFLQQPGSSF